MRPMRLELKHYFFNSSWRTLYVRQLPVGFIKWHSGPRCGCSAAFGTGNTHEN